jgi:hypothetical protein
MSAHGYNKAYILHSEILCQSWHNIYEEVGNLSNLETLPYDISYIINCILYTNFGNFDDFELMLSLLFFKLSSTAGVWGVKGYVRAWCPAWGDNKETHSHASDMNEALQSTNFWKLVIEQKNISSSLGG